MRLRLEKIERLPEHIYERLEACLLESSTPQNVVPYIFGEFTVYELQKITEILLETIYIKNQ